LSDFEDILNPPTLEPTPERRELYQAIGEATTAWAKVEGCLGAVFISMVAGNVMEISNVLRNFAARAAFHAIVNFNSKLAATNAAARWFLAGKPNSLERWNALQNRAKRQAKRRNDIVHFALIRGGPIPFGPFEDYLAPSLYGTYHLTFSQLPQLRSTDIRARAKSFRALADDLLAFVATIDAEPRAPLQEYPERGLENPPDMPDRA
jgi:hypothetical protein